MPSSPREEVLGLPSKNVITSYLGIIGSCFYLLLLAIVMGYTNSKTVEVNSLPCRRPLDCELDSTLGSDGLASSLFVQVTENDRLFAANGNELCQVTLGWNQAESGVSAAFRVELFNAYQPWRRGLKRTLVAFAIFPILILPFLLMLKMMGSYQQKQKKQRHSSRATTATRGPGSSSSGEAEASSSSSLGAQAASPGVRASDLAYEEYQNTLSLVGFIALCIQWVLGLAHILCACAILAAGKAGGSLKKDEILVQSTASPGPGFYAMLSFLILVGAGLFGYYCLVIKSPLFTTKFSTKKGRRDFLDTLCNCLSKKRNEAGTGVTAGRRQPPSIATAIGSNRFVLTAVLTFLFLVVAYTANSAIAEVKYSCTRLSNGTTAGGSKSRASSSSSSPSSSSSEGTSSSSGVGSGASSPSPTSSSSSWRTPCGKNIFEYNASVLQTPVTLGNATLNNVYPFTENSTGLENLGSVCSVVVGSFSQTSLGLSLWFAPIAAPRRLTTSGLPSAGTWALVGSLGVTSLGPNQENGRIGSPTREGEDRGCTLPYWAVTKLGGLLIGFTPVIIFLVILPVFATAGILVEKDSSAYINYKVGAILFLAMEGLGCALYLGGTWLMTSSALGTCEGVTHAGLGNGFKVVFVFLVVLIIGSATLGGMFHQAQMQDAEELTTGLADVPDHLGAIGGDGDDEGRTGANSTAGRTPQIDLGGGALGRSDDTVRSNIYSGGRSRQGEEEDEEMVRREVNDEPMDAKVNSAVTSTVVEETDGLDSDVRASADVDSA